MKFEHKHKIIQLIHIRSIENFQQGYVTSEEACEYLISEDCKLNGCDPTIDIIEKMMNNEEYPFERTQKIYDECKIRSLYWDLVEYVDFVKGPFTIHKGSVRIDYYRMGGSSSINVDAFKEFLKDQINHSAQQSRSKI